MGSKTRAGGRPNSRVRKEREGGGGRVFLAQGGVKSLTSILLRSNWRGKYVPCVSPGY